MNESMRHFICKFAKYICVGGFAALVDWLTFYLLTESGLWYFSAGLISFVLATLANFILARKFIFGTSHHSLAKEGALIYLVSLGGLMLNMFVLFVCIEWLTLHAMLGKIFATAAAFVLNFTLRFFWIYHKSEQ